MSHLLQVKGLVLEHGGDADQAIAALIRDLEERKMLDSTLVMVTSEFGRTPNINSREGRDHHPRAWSVVLAGGGIRGGVVHGATDDRGDKVIAKPVTIANLLATMLSHLGVAPDTMAMSRSGRPITATDYGSVIADLLES